MMHLVLIFVVKIKKNKYLLNVFYFTFTILSFFKMENKSFVSFNFMYMSNLVYFDFLNQTASISFNSNRY
jgi:hypothetical protein